MRHGAIPSVSMGWTADESQEKVKIRFTDRAPQARSAQHPAGAAGGRAGQGGRPSHAAALRVRAKSSGQCVRADSTG